MKRFNHIKMPSHSVTLTDTEVEEYAEKLGNYLLSGTKASVLRKSLCFIFYRADSVKDFMKELVRRDAEMNKTINP